jgi:hypothetical protein
VPQYSASKHGVLGVMRALDPVVAADNIRIALSSLFLVCKRRVSHQKSPQA